MGCLILGPWGKTKIKQDPWSEYQTKFKAKLTAYLENELHFRDYTIKPLEKFGAVNTVAVHQQVYSDTMDQDVSDALYSFERDNFSTVVFYV